MNKIANIFLSFALLLVVAACSNETPFSDKKGSEGEGRFLSSALKVELKTDEKLVRSEGVPDVTEFTVDFVDTDNDNEVVKSFKYGEMPEVVTLPVGNYIVKAHYGGDYGNGKKAAFGKPYYLGESEPFAIAKDMINDNIGTIVCKLANVRVTILFDENLVAVMSADSKVSVKVGESGELDFTRATTESGYFAYDEGSNTLGAEFSGEIDGDPTTESKSYKDVKPGNHYRITFKLHKVDSNEPGDINPGDPGSEIKVDANIQFEDFSVGGGTNAGDVKEEDQYMEDDRYPSDDPTPDDPGPGLGDGPVITAQAPINLDEWNIAKEGLQCILNVHSETGVTGFKVKIKSPSLTNDVLTGVGLASEFDLVTGKTAAGADVTEGLQSLGLPVGSEVKGQKDVVFNVSDFMGLLGIYGAADHIFVLTVKDAGGTTVKELKLRTE